MLTSQGICSTRKESNLDSPEILCMLISKFPGYVRERWNRKVPSIKRTHKRDPKFDLLTFVKEESMLVNDPLFFKNGVKFFAETGSGGRRSETGLGGRKKKNSKKGNKCKLLCYGNVRKRK